MRLIESQKGIDMLKLQSKVQFNVKINVKEKRAAPTGAKQISTAPTDNEAFWDCVAPVHDKPFLSF